MMGSNISIENVRRRLDLEWRQWPPKICYLNVYKIIQFKKYMFLEDVRGVSISRPQDVSAFHLIVWVFAVSFPLQEDSRRRIRAMYGNSSEIIDPVTPNIQAFQKVMLSIKSKNQKCVVKVVTDAKMSQKVVEVAKKDKKIIQIYFFNPKGAMQPSFVTNNTRTRSVIVGTATKNAKSQGTEVDVIDVPAVRSDIIHRKSKVVGVIRDFQQAIQRAEREVEAFTKSFRTFENSHCLTEDLDKISRYRFRLIACINLKVSDFAQALNAFKAFVVRVAPWLNSHLEGMGKSGLSAHCLHASLQRYTAAATNLMQEEEIERTQPEQSQHTDAHREEFFHEVMSLYQDEGLFYHLLNSHLKVVGEQDAAWRELSMPFAHVYGAVKHLYKRGITTQPQFYTQPFIVFRGGRARRSELNRYKELAGKTFIEFYGFLSTSLSAKIVADRFVDFRNSKDSQTKEDEENYDEEVIFRIEVNPNSRINAEKYDFLVNGFFRMTTRQTHGEAEKEVLFNALNVYKLKGVRKETIINLFCEDEVKEMQLKREEIRQIPFFKYSEEAKRIESYKRQIIVVDLEFGSFYDVLLTDNPFELTAWERAAKENYVYCMNKISRFHKFDYGDACELTSDLQEAYRYLKSKVGSSEEDLYDSSKADNKNYFQRLSAVCGKLGKTREALNYSRIAIECYKQLESVHLNEVYNAHYERLFDMQMRSIEILRECSNFTAAEKQLKEQLREIRGKHFSEPKARLRESEVYINQAINYYSMGKLEESINRFAKCEHQLKKTIADFSFEDEALPCYLPAFVQQLFCGHPEMQRTFSYCEYGENLRQLQRQRREQQLVQRHGRKEELEQTSKLANDLLAIANEAVKNRKSLFKSRKTYADFIAKFSHQFSLSSLEIKGDASKGAKSDLEEQIKQKILQLSSLDQDGSEYIETLSSLNKLIDRYSQLEHSSLQTDGSEHSIWNFIKKFKDKERERKIERLKARKESVLTENRQQLMEQYLRCVTEIEEAIDALRAEGYVSSSIAILKMRIEKLKIYEQCDQKVAAMKEIQEIIEMGSMSGEEKFNEVASAYSIKGKIHLQMKEIELAIISFNEALNCFQKTGQHDSEDKLDVSMITQTPIGFTSIESTQSSKKQQLNHNNDYIQTKILKIKALLMWIEIKRNRENSIPSNIFSNTRNGSAWQMWHSDEHMRDVQYEISELRGILEARGELEDVAELTCQLLEVELHFYLNLNPSEDNVNHALGSLKECLSHRINQLGKNNNKNALMCCQIIARYAEREDFLLRFLQEGHIECLKAAEADFRNCTFAWKIERTYFFLQRAREGAGSVRARAHLQKAIELLEAEPVHSSQSQQALNSLKWRLAERGSIIPAQGCADGIDMDNMQLPMESALTRRSNSRYRLKQTCRSKNESVSTNNTFESSMLTTLERVRIRPQNPQAQFTEKSGLLLRNFYKRKGRNKRKIAFLIDE